MPRAISVQVGSGTESAHATHPLAMADVCIICHDAHTPLSRLCRQCRAAMCGECTMSTISYSAQDIDTLAAPIACPGCRTWLFPSFAQVAQTELLFDALLRCDFGAFWSRVGVPDHPSIDVSAHLFAAYMYAATIQNRMRQQSREFTARRRTLRSSVSRSTTMAHHLRIVAAREAAFVTTRPWPRSLLGDDRFPEEP